MERLDQALARRLLIVAIALGVLIEFAFDGPAYGINVPIVVAATLAGGWIVRRQDRAPDRLDAWLPVTALVLASLAAIRGDEFLAGLDITTSFLFTGASLAAMSGIAVTRRSASVIALIGAWSLAATLLDGMRVLGGVRPIRAETDVPPSDDRLSLFMGVARGLVVGVPLAAIFAVLFASADPIFRRAMTDLFGFRIDLGDLPGRVTFAASATWLAAGALSVAARGVPDVEVPSLGAVAWAPQADFRARSLGRTEALVILGLIDLVIALFVMLQLAYLFGGPSALASSGFTYADYARRGFFELVAAASLAAVVVVVLEAVVTQRSRAYLAALLGLVGLTGGLLISAMLRLRLYQDAYGWTELRLYVLVAIVTMGAGLIAMAALIVAGRSRWLTHGLAVIGVVSLVGLNLLTPGGFVAERNIERVLVPSLVPPDGHPGLDLEYLRVLPDDAIPAMVTALPRLPEVERGQVTAFLMQRRVEFRLDQALAGPFAWNLGRERAKAALDMLP